MKPTKIETIPFLLTPQAATRTLENAAHAAFGVSGTAKLLLSRFLHRFNIPYDPPLKCIAFRPLLVPTWRVDLRLCARGVLGEVGMQFMLTATDASLPGFKLPPLDQLAMTAPWETEPVKFDPEVHLNQHGEAVGQLPFTHSPLNFLATLAALPRLNAQKNGISFDPTSIKTQLFAAYPLYLPIYLGEFVEDSDEARHVTTVAYASLAKTAFAIYPTFLESPSWMPNSEGLEISLGGMPVDLDKPPEPDALRKLAPQLNQLLVEGKTLSTRDPVSPEEIETNPRVMAYSEHAFENREYIKAHEELVSIEALMKKIESIPDSVKAVSVSLKGIKIGDGPSWKVLMKKKLFQAQKRVEVTKPQWMDELQAKTAADAAARKSANGRPR